MLSTLHGEEWNDPLQAVTLSYYESMGVRCLSMYERAFKRPHARSYRRMVLRLVGGVAYDEVSSVVGPQNLSSILPGSTRKRSIATGRLRSLVISDTRYALARQSLGLVVCRRVALVSEYFARSVGTARGLYYR